VVIFLQSELDLAIEKYCGDINMRSAEHIGLKDRDMPKPDFIYRSANELDYQDVKKILEEIFELQISEGNYRAYLEDCTKCILVAAAGATVGGCCCFEVVTNPLNNVKTCFIRYLGVLPEYRKYGIASGMLGIVKEFARCSHIKPIELTCADWRTDSHRFYKNNEFTIKKTKIFICEV